MEDFYASGPRDRHYRFERDETQAAAIVFGDGHNGAIPPAGRKNVAAEYRVGLGPDGHVYAAINGLCPSDLSLLTSQNSPPGACPAAGKVVRLRKS